MREDGRMGGWEGGKKINSIRTHRETWAQQERDEKDFQWRDDKAERCPERVNMEDQIVSLRI